MGDCTFILRMGALGMVALGGCSGNENKGANAFGSGGLPGGGHGGSASAGQSAGQSAGAGAAGAAGLATGGSAGTTANDAGRGGSLSSGGSAASAGAPGGSSGTGGVGAGEGGASGSAGASGGTSGGTSDGYGPCSTPSDCHVPNSICSPKYGCRPPCDNPSNLCHTPAGSTALTDCVMGYCALTCSPGVLTCPSDLVCSESDFCVMP